MTIADILDPVYITSAPKTFILKLCIGLIAGFVAHKIAHITDDHDQKYIFKWSLIASVAGTIVVVVVYMAVRPVLKKAGLFFHI